jgi:hypothetical protein
MSEDQSCDIGLTAKWFPGEVTWSADPSDPAASASVTGKGKPIDLKYEKVAADDPWLARQPALFIRLANRAYSRHLPLTSISRGQPFLVEVVLSAKDAAAQGDELTVSLRASRSGGGDTVTLKGERNFSGAWEYRPESPIVLKPDAKFATMIVSDWLREYGHQNGNMDFVKEEPPGTLAFATENGDELVASYRDADGGAVSQMVVVFDNAVEQARDAIETQLDELTVLEQALLMGGRLNARQIKVAELRLRLIADGRALMAYEPGTFEHWPPSLLMALAAQFWVLAVDADPDMFFNSEIAPPEPPDEYGVSYFSRNERLVAHAVIDDVKSKAISDYFKSVDAELTDRVAYNAILSHYTGISVDDFNAAYYGVDQDGNLLETSDRVLAGIRVPLTLFVHWADAVGASGGAGATTAAGKIARFEETATTSVLAAAAKSAGGAEEILLGVPAQAMAASGGLGHLLPSARIVSKSAKDAFFRQCNRYACALQSFAHAAYEAGAAFVPEALARGWAARQKIFNPLGGTTFAALREYASRFGARVGVAQLTLTEIKAFLDQGKFVLVGIRTTYGGAHALRMLNVIKSAAGQTLAVVFYDPGPGAIISMTACDFRQMRAGVSNTTFVFDFK